jgi:hypothetical protein
MPEANQYMSSPRELTELLIKSSGIREGRWFLVATFGFAPGNFGPTPAQLAPGAAVVVQGIGIQREGPGIPEEMLVDASKLMHEVAASKRGERRKLP